MATDPPVFTFETTHHALWAEDVAREDRIPAEVIPAPSEASSRCELALRTLPDRVTDLEAALEARGVPFDLWPTRS